MPTKHCAHGTCKSDSRKKDPKIKFVAFPKPSVNTARTKRWLYLCGREGFQLKHVKRHGSYVCSLHFPQEAVLDTFKNPDLEPFNARLKLQKTPDENVTTNIIGRVAKRKCQPEPKVKAAKNYLKTFQPNRHKLSQVSTTTSNFYVVPNVASPTKIDAPQMSPSKTLYVDNVDEAEPSIPPSPSKTLKRLKSEVHWRNKYRILLQKHKRLMKKMREDRQLPKLIRSSDEWGIFYTGLSRESRDLLFDFLGPSKNNLKIIDSQSKKTSGELSICVEDQFLLMLVKLRQNFPFTDLAQRFKITRQMAARLFKTWIQFTFLEFGEIRDQLFRRYNQIKKPLPAHFQNQFLRRTRCVIDCTEFKLETSRDFRQQGNNYSCYKSHATAKVLIGVAPNGSFSFASDCFEGSISDKEIVKKSGFINHIQPGDVILADRGFLIEDLLKEKKAALVIPPFLHGRTQFTLRETQLTKVIARARIHVERFMERLKNFKFFNGVIPLIHLPLLSQAVFVACCLVNFTKTLTE